MDHYTCAECSGSIPTDRRGRYCSSSCANRWKWRNQKRIPCGRCGNPSGWRDSESHRARLAGRVPYCSDCRGAAPKGSKPPPGRRPTECAHCGSEFESTRVRETWTRYCSRSCRGKADFAAGRLKSLRVSDRVGPDPEKLRVKGERSRRRRRARLAEVESEPYTLAEIAERDGFKCGLCGRGVDMDLKYPHPRSASVDHIVPLSKGGSDLKSNVRLAHLGENVTRGNRTEWEQELLIG